MTELRWLTFGLRITVMPRATFLVFNGNNALLLPETENGASCPRQQHNLNVKTWSRLSQLIIVVKMKVNSTRVHKTRFGFLLRFSIPLNDHQSLFPPVGHGNARMLFSTGSCLSQLPVPLPMTTPSLLLQFQLSFSRFPSKSYLEFILRRH